MHSSLVAVCLSLIILHASSLTYAFAPLFGQNRRTNPYCRATHGRHFLARLYEDPLPPRRPLPPLDKPKVDEPDDADNDYLDDTERQRLFQFHSNGTEVNGLLPSLGRSLASNIPCYFEPSDRKVINLVDKTLCHVEDACWALEACKGDITEAWTCISVARRTQYSTMAVDPAMAALDRDVYEMEIEEEFEERKGERRRMKQIQDRDEFFQGGVPDQNIWPNFRPGPDENEPWFTG